MPSDTLTIQFRCAPELAGAIPRPISAVEGLPDWFKKMPTRAASDLLQKEQFTVKRCPPFIDAMTSGFLLPLITDVTVKDGVFTWEHDVPRGSSPITAHSPIDFHDNSQVAGSPFFQEDRVLVKFNSFWTVQLPPGYSLLVTHPFNRLDLPFVTLTGIVDSDRYQDNFINFPALWRDADFAGVLPRGTPLAQCMPIRREEWTASFDVLDGAATARINEVQSALAHETDVYRHRFRSPKR